MIVQVTYTSEEIEAILEREAMLDIYGQTVPVGVASTGVFYKAAEGTIMDEVEATINISQTRKAT